MFQLPIGFFLFYANSMRSSSVVIIWDPSNLVVCAIFVVNRAQNTSIDQSIKRSASANNMSSASGDQGGDDHRRAKRYTCDSCLLALTMFNCLKVPLKSVFWNNGSIFLAYYALC